MDGILDIAALQAAIGSGEIDTVLVCFPDMQGRLIGKRVTGRFFLDQCVDEMHVCDYLLTVDMDMEPVPGYQAASWDKGYGDFALKPDLATLRRIPWLEATALVMADCVDHHGEDLGHAPRSILKRQLARARALGFIAKMGSELELYVFDETYDGAREKGYRGLATAGWYSEDYHIFQTTKEEGLIRAIRNGMEGAGVPVEFSKGEWGPGQEEINLRYAEALVMADRHSIYKNGAKEIAYAQGKAITFMAKWENQFAGNSCHIHSSLWNADNDTPVFHDGAAADGMSDVFRHYLAGQLTLASEMTYFLAPYVNSYKRFQAGSFAPTKTGWSRDNRTAGFRLVGHGPAFRVECRIPGADANPYLVYAALLAAGLDGIERGLDPGPACPGNVYDAEGLPRVPETLRAATDALDESAFARGAFGDAVVDHLVHFARTEQGAFDGAVTDWERARFFERI